MPDNITERFPDKQGLIGMIMSAHLVPVLHGKRYTTTYPVRLKPIRTPLDIFKPGAISRCSFVEAAS